MSNEKKKTHEEGKFLPSDELVQMRLGNVSPSPGGLAKPASANPEVSQPHVLRQGMQLHSEGRRPPRVSNRREESACVGFSSEGSQIFEVQGGNRWGVCAFSDGQVF